MTTCDLPGMGVYAALPYGHLTVNVGNAKSDGPKKAHRFFMLSG